MNPSNLIVQTLWIGESLSVMERLSLASFIHHGHEVHLYTYGDIKGVPPGVVVKDANDIISPSFLDYRKFPKLSFFADIFRYKLLFEKGGWWVDTDVVCVKPFDFEEETIVASEATREGGVHPTNGIIKSPPNTWLMGELWGTCRRLEPTTLQWGDTGPRLIKEMVEKLNLNFVVKPPVTFCPVPWWETNRFNNPSDDIPTIPDEAYAVHLWNEQWQYTDFRKTMLNPGSLYAELINKYDTQPDMSNVTAVIKTFLRDRSLFHCVQTLKSSYPSIHIIVADDGHCTPEKEAQLKSMGVDMYIQLPWDRGLSVGRNRLVKEVTTPYLLLCDDDFSFTPECHIEKLLELTEVVDIAGGLVYNLRNWNMCEVGAGWDVTGGNFVKRDGVLWVDGTRGETRLHNGVRYETADFILNFFIAKKEIIERVRWDNEMKVSSEHIDFALRAKSLGITSGRCLDSYVLHKAIDDVKDAEYLNSHKDADIYREVFEKKWGFPFPEHLRETLPRIDEPAPARLIEIPQPPRQVGILPAPPVKDWQDTILETKVRELFSRFKFVAATEPNSAHYKSLCQIYPKHIEEEVITSKGKSIIFVVDHEPNNVG